MVSMSEGNPFREHKAFYRLSSEEPLTAERIESLKQYSVIICSQNVRTELLRDIEGICLLAMESAVSVPAWGVGDPFWDEYRAMFDVPFDYFFRLDDGLKAKIKLWDAWWHLPLLGVADKKLDWYNERLRGFDGLYLDMANRGYPRHLIERWGLPILDEDLVEWHDRQAAFVDYFIKTFRRRFPSDALILNLKGYSTKYHMVRYSGIVRPWLTGEEIKCISGISIENPTEVDIPYYKRVALKCLSHPKCHSIAWFSGMNIPGVVMPGTVAVAT